MRGVADLSSRRPCRETTGGRSWPVAGALLLALTACAVDERAAAPAYEACHWPARDAENRSWITEIVALMKRWFGFGLLDGTYLVEVPVLVLGMDLVIIGLMSWTLCLISAWLPARRAAQLNPVEGLHR